MSHHDGHHWKRVDRDVFHALILLAYGKDEQGGWTGLDLDRLSVCATFTDVEAGEFYTEWGLRDRDLPMWREHRTRNPSTGEDVWTHDVLIPD